MNDLLKLAEREAIEAVIADWMREPNTGRPWITPEERKSLAAALRFLPARCAFCVEQSLEFEACANGCVANEEPTDEQVAEVIRHDLAMDDMGDKQ